MKATLFLLATSTLTLPTTILAQGTYLSAPDGNPSRALVVTDEGRIGIGTESPNFFSLMSVGGDVYVGGNAANGGIAGAARILHIANDVDDPNSHARLDLGVRSTLGGDPFINFGIGGSRRAWAMGIDNRDGQKFKLATRDGTSGVENMTDGLNVLTFDTSGNVGIGTTAPQGTLHILHPNRPDALVISRAVADSPRMLIGQGPGGDTLDSYFLSSSKMPGGNFVPMTFWTGDRERLRLDVDGNIGIGTTTPQSKLDVNGKINCTVLELTSDQNQKQDFAAVDSRSVLDQLVGLPIQTWAYTNDTKVRHIGPTAQDWKAAFPALGSDDKHIGAGDLGSVALAAIQALHTELRDTKLEFEGKTARMTESLKEKDVRIAVLEQKLAQVGSLIARLANMEKLMAQAPSSHHEIIRTPDGPQAKADEMGKVNCPLLEAILDPIQKRDLSLIDQRAVSHVPTIVASLPTASKNDN